MPSRVSSSWVGRAALQLRAAPAVLLGRSRCWPFWRGELVSSSHRKAGPGKVAGSHFLRPRVLAGLAVQVWAGLALQLLSRSGCLFPHTASWASVPGSAARLDSAWFCLRLGHGNKRYCAASGPGQRERAEGSSWEGLLHAAATVARKNRTLRLADELPGCQPAMPGQERRA